MRDERSANHDEPTGRSRSRAGARGFTLIEVLVALAIVAIALAAVMRAIGSLASNTDAARMRLLALWSADNALGAIRISAGWPAIGSDTFACPQGPYPFVCRQSVAALSSPLVRTVTVSVYPSATSRTVLAQVVTVVQDEARH
ncbi:general secretion pathway protein I [Burkholderia sp. lig30]|jgi:general secretion pathway protein I|uniref:type II secretion system minor pseudopilin GspI n=1 Tax=Burkholderia sp. lig30 TaxID=1192124 RepID=UPI000461FDB5|nr:type II secretion system minor pseudopilin GspI [Burkholderia sp. lig30]KDB10721.1 general secretion pathway protein I [Burkholderia sp. lig30]